MPVQPRKKPVYIFSIQQIGIKRRKEEKEIEMMMTGGLSSFLMDILTKKQATAYPFQCVYKVNFCFHIQFFNRFDPPRLRVVF